MSLLQWFQYPWALLGILFLPLLVWDYFRKTQRRKASIRFPSLKVIHRIPATIALKARHTLLVLRILVLAAIIIALARPRLGEEIVDVSTEGVDIVLALDVSQSMSTMDFKPRNRLTVAKQVIENFILGRRFDRLGLVVFADQAFTQCPLTLDYNILVSFLKGVELGMVGNSTAIGTAILTGTNRLRESTAKSKVIILATDGENTAGEVDPITAARAAKAVNVKIYTVGVGKDGEQPMEVEDPMFGKRIVSVPTRIDEESLKRIAGMTGGQYFRAQDPESLRKIYATIDEMEKTEIQSNRYTRYSEMFHHFVLAAFAILALEIGLASTRFMKIP